MELVGVGKTVLVLFFMANAIFWGLAPHSLHCRVAAMTGMSGCKPHSYHVYVLGLLSYLIAIFIEQGKSLGYY